MCAVVLKGEALPIPPTCATVPDAVRGMIAACFEVAENRPSFDQLHRDLSELLVQHIQATSTIPLHHMCRLSLERMTDPVRAADGFLYERSCIDAWLRTSDASPVTNRPLANRTLTPELGLRKELQILLPPPPAAVNK